MLETARARIKAVGLERRIQVAQGDATNFDLASMFGIATADRIVISYALSMISPWRQVIDCSCQQLSSQGSLHIVDFGHLERLPLLAKSALYCWLARFSVKPSPDLEPELRRQAHQFGLDAFVAHPCRGYATYAVLRRI